MVIPAGSAHAGGHQQSRGGAHFGGIGTFARRVVSGDEEVIGGAGAQAGDRIVAGCRAVDLHGRAAAAVEPLDVVARGADRTIPTHGDLARPPSGADPGRGWRNRCGAHQGGVSLGVPTVHTGNGVIISGARSQAGNQKAGEAGGGNGQTGLPDAISAGPWGRVPTYHDLRVPARSDDASRGGGRRGRVDFGRIAAFAGGVGGADHKKVRGIHGKAGHGITGRRGGINCDGRAAADSPQAHVVAGRTGRRVPTDGDLAVAGTGGNSSGRSRGCGSANFARVGAFPSRIVSADEEIIGRPSAQAGNEITGGRCAVGLDGRPPAAAKSFDVVAGGAGRTVPTDGDLT